MTSYLYPKCKGVVRVFALRACGGFCPGRRLLMEDERHNSISRRFEGSYLVLISQGIITGPLAVETPRHHGIVRNSAGHNSGSSGENKEIVFNQCMVGV